MDLFSWAKKGHDLDGGAFRPGLATFVAARSSPIGKQSQHRHVSSRSMLDRFDFVLLNSQLNLLLSYI